MWRGVSLFPRVLVQAARDVGAVRCVSRGVCRVSRGGCPWYPAQRDPSIQVRTLPTCFLGTLSDLGLFGSAGATGRGLGTSEFGERWASAHLGRGAGLGGQGGQEEPNVSECGEMPRSRGIGRGVHSALPPGFRARWGPTARSSRGSSHAAA